MARKREQPTVIGWREWISLPELGIDAIKAKVDTGARTSALHAMHLQLFERDSTQWATFEIHPLQHSAAGSVTVEYPIAGWRKVRSSNGVVQDRPVIHTEIELAGRRWPIDITLTGRDEMGFRMLIGRAAIKRRFVVDPGRSFLGEKLAQHA